MPIPAYRAKQSTDTAGTGTIVLNAAGTNARSFAAAYGALSRRVMYCISWATGFEIGYGDFDGGTPGNLTRAAVVASSNAGALVTLPAGTKDVFSVFDPAAREVLSIAGTTTLALADLGNAVVFTGASAATLNLPAIATVPAGAGWTVQNAGTAALTIDPSGAETINGNPTRVLDAGQSAFIFDSGSAWQCIVAGGIPDDGAVTTAKLDFAVTGMVAFFPGNVAPLGWLKINGALLSRTTYAALWAYAQASGNIVTDAAWLAGATGSFSQGDGSTTFRLPDYRGEFLRGWDDGRGVDSGRAFGSTQSHALQNHNHTVDSYINGALGASGRPQEGTAGNSDSFSTLTSGTTGNFASETRPRNIALLACIKF